MSVTKDINRDAPPFSATASMSTVDLSSDHPSAPDYTASPNIPFSAPYAPWPHRLSASFSAMADQIAATSQALALVPSTAFGGLEGSNDVVNLKARMDGIERTQGKILMEFEALKVQMTRGETEIKEVGTEAKVEGGTGGSEGTNAVLTEKIEERQKCTFFFSQHSTTAKNAYQLACTIRVLRV